MALAVTPTDLYWIGPEPEHDLCAHGGVEVVIGGEVFLADDDVVVSAGALHLLRTLERDHTPDAPVAEHLLPHCGHFMVLDPDTGEAFNIGCPQGANWWVRHDGANVLLTREDGAERRVRRGEWARAVAEFADEVAAFYTASPPRQPTDKHDAAWLQALWDEWRLRRAAIPAGA